MALAQKPQPQADIRLNERAEQFYEERRYIIRSPIPRYYAIAVGLVLTPLGIAGLIPEFTRGGVLFHVLRTSVGISCIYLATGIAGLFCGNFRRGRYAHLFTLVTTGLYLTIFSSGNIAFGNAEGTSPGLPDFPWIFENALHAGLMLTGALITGLGALQMGDRATAREFERRYGIVDPHVNKQGHGRRRRGAEKIEEIRGTLRARILSLVRGGLLLAATFAVTLLFPVAVHAWSRRKIESNAHATDGMSDDRLGTT